MSRDPVQRKLQRQVSKEYVLDYIQPHYSCVSIKRAGSNKQAGRKFCKKLITEQALISEQGGILIIFSKTSRLFKQDFD